jgi:hypothetical protein
LLRSTGKNLGDFYDLVPLMMRELLCRFNDESAMVVKSASDALLALSNNVSAEVLVDHIEFMRNVIASLVSDARRRKGGVGQYIFNFILSVLINKRFLTVDVLYIVR